MNSFILRFSEVIVDPNSSIDPKNTNASHSIKLCYDTNRPNNQVNSTEYLIVMCKVACNITQNCRYDNKDFFDERSSHVRGCRQLLPQSHGIQFTLFVKVWTSFDPVQEDNSQNTMCNICDRETSFERNYSKWQKKNSELKENDEKDINP